MILRGEVFYDADCALCSRGARRWGGMFARRGYCCLPMQAPGAASSLGVSDTELGTEMKLRLVGGGVIGGVDAWAILFRAVWWLWPLGVLIRMPGVRTMGGVIYRWMARNRYRISDACGLHQRELVRHRHAAFFELP